MYIFTAPFETGSRSLAQVAAYLTQNGYHRLYRDEMLVETADFASLNDDGSAIAVNPLMVVVDRIAVTAGGGWRKRRGRSLRSASP